MTASAHRSSTRTRRLMGLIPLIVAVMLLLAACAGGAAKFENVGDELQPQDGAPGEPAASAGAADGDRGGTSGEEATPPFADLVDRQIVKTGEMTIEVTSVASAVGQVRAMALELGGYVGASRSGGLDESATLTLRIPADRFDTAISRLHDMDGELKAEATREEDVTGSVVDLEARIRNLQASEAQYRALLEQAVKIEDILTVQSRLDDVRGQIEQLQAQRDQLADLAQLSTLTVTLVPASALIEETAEGWDAGAILESATAALVAVGQGIATVAIWLGIVGIPVLIVVGLLSLVALRVAPGMRRRAVPPAGPVQPTE